MRVVHVSWSDFTGGAARAAVRLHDALQAAGVDSWMLVADKQGDDPRVVRHRPASRLHRVLRRWLRPPLERAWTARLARGEPLLSMNLVPTGILDAAWAMRPDVVNLHWTGFETASIEEIGRWQGPTVWTLHDMWAFSGASHYDRDEAGAVWQAGPGPGTAWRERMTWARKARAWRSARFEFVTPSRWLAGCVARSALFRGRRAEVIPNPIDLDRFRPRGAAAARERLGLPPDRPLLGFGAVGGLQDPRKGADLLKAALRELPAGLRQRRPLLCVFGQARPAAPPDMPCEVHWLGRIDDEGLMPLIYSALDVMLVPSVMDNLPLTGIEAQACGCPVVTFDATGLPEVVEHRQTGYCASAGSAAALAQGIAWVLEDDARRAALGAAARGRAETLWSPATVTRAYRSLYERAAAAKER